MKKSIVIASVSAMVLAMSAPISAFAANSNPFPADSEHYNTQNDTYKLDNNAKECKTQVSYDVAGIYFVTIPASVKLGANDVEGTFKVTGETDDKAPLLEDGQRVVVKLNDSTNYDAANNKFYVKAGTSDNAKLEYTVKNPANQAIKKGDTLVEFPYQPTYTVADNYTKKAKFAIGTGTPQYAGTYTDTLTFTVSVENAPKTLTIEDFGTITYTPGQKWSEVTLPSGWAWSDGSYNCFRNLDLFYLMFRDSQGVGNEVGRDDVIDESINYYIY